VLTAQFRTVSGGQYSVGRAFNERLKKLVDKSDDVRFAQTYPQQIWLPKRTAHVDEPDEEVPASVVLTEQPRPQ